MDRLLLVDGSNLLFQMFYGMPARIVNPDGKAIQGTLGFVGALLKMVRLVKPTHIAVLFDGEYASQRRELDENYKSNREDLSSLPEEETPFSQLPDIYRALDHMGICHRETENCEADDWLAGYALGYGKQLQIVIASQDSDLFQLISDNVRILRYRGDSTVIWDRQLLHEKLGIHPEQYADHKAMTGDTADNIKGIPHIGPKTATALLQQFGSIQRMLECTEAIRKPSIRAAVEAGRERLERNRKLIALTGEHSLPFEIHQLRCGCEDMTTAQVLKAIGLR